MTGQKSMLRVHPHLNKVGPDLAHLGQEYVHRYNRLLEHEKQPHSDFFVNLSEDFEDELDFNEDRPADLSQYDQYFEWDEAEYMKLRFTAARHYASCGHWTDAYAYVLRTSPDNIPQHEDTYNRNAQVWYKARHAHKRLYTVLPKYSKIQVLPGITSCRLVKDNKQAIELNSSLLNNMPKDGYG